MDVMMMHHINMDTSPGLIHVRDLLGHEDDINICVFNEKDGLLYSADSSTMRLWTLQRCMRKRSIPIQEGFNHCAQFVDAIYSEIHDIFIVACGGNPVKPKSSFAGYILGFDANLNMIFQVSTNSKKQILGLEYNSENDILYSYDKTGTINMWSIVDHGVFDGNRVVDLNCRKSISLNATPTCLKYASHNGIGVLLVALSSSKFLIIAYDFLRVITEAKCIHEISAVTFDPVISTVYIGYKTGLVELYEMNVVERARGSVSLKFQCSVEAHASPIANMTFVPKQNNMVSCEQNGILRLWCGLQAVELGRYILDPLEDDKNTLEVKATSLETSKTLRLIVASPSKGATCTKQYLIARNRKRISILEVYSYAVHLSTRLSRVLRLNLQDQPESQPVDHGIMRRSSIPHHAYLMNALCGENELVVYDCVDGTAIRSIDLNHPHPRASLVVNTYSQVMCHSWSKTLSAFIVGWGDGSVSAVNDHGDVIRAFVTPPGTRASIALLEIIYGAEQGNGNHAKAIATGHSDGFINIWNIKTGELVRNIEAHTSSLLALIRQRSLGGHDSNSTKGFISASVGGEVKMWDSVTLEVKSTFQISLPRKRQTDSPDILSSVTILHGSGYVACGLSCGILQIWRLIISYVQNSIEMGSETCLATVFAHESRITSISQSEIDSSIIATGAADGSIAIWYLSKDPIALFARATFSLPYPIENLCFSKLYDELIISHGKNLSFIPQWSLPVDYLNATASDEDNEDFARSRESSTEETEEVSEGLSDEQMQTLYNSFRSYCFQESDTIMIYDLGSVLKSIDCVVENTDFLDMLSNHFGSSEDGESKKTFTFDEVAQVANVVRHFDGSIPPRAHHDGNDGDANMGPGSPTEGSRRGKTYKDMCASKTHIGFNEFGEKIVLEQRSVVVKPSRKDVSYHYFDRDANRRVAVASSSKKNLGSALPNSLMSALSAFCRLKDVENTDVTPMTEELTLRLARQVFLEKALVDKMMVDDGDAATFSVGDVVVLLHERCFGNGHGFSKLLRDKVVSFFYSMSMFASRLPACRSLLRILANDVSPPIADRAASIYTRIFRQVFEAQQHSKQSAVANTKSLNGETSQLVLVFHALHNTLGDVDDASVVEAIEQKILSFYEISSSSLDMDEKLNIQVQMEDVLDIVIRVFLEVKGAKGKAPEMETLNRELTSSQIDNVALSTSETNASTRSLHKIHSGVLFLESTVADQSDTRSHLDKHRKSERHVESSNAEKEIAHDGEQAPTLMIQPSIRESKIRNVNNTKMSPAIHQQTMDLGVLPEANTTAFPNLIRYPKPLAQTDPRRPVLRDNILELGDFGGDQMFSKRAEKSPKRSATSRQMQGPKIANVHHSQSERPMMHSSKSTRTTRDLVSSESTRSRANRHANAYADIDIQHLPILNPSPRPRSPKTPISPLRSDGGFLEDNIITVEEEFDVAGALEELEAFMEQENFADSIIMETDLNELVVDTISPAENKSSQNDKPDDGLVVGTLCSAEENSPLQNDACDDEVVEEIQTSHVIVEQLHNDEFEFYQQQSSVKSLASGVEDLVSNEGRQIIPETELELEPKNDFTQSISSSVYFMESNASNSMNPSLFKSQLSESKEISNLLDTEKETDDTAEEIFSKGEESADISLEETNQLDENQSSQVNQDSVNANAKTHDTPFEAPSSCLDEMSPAQDMGVVATAMQQAESFGAELVESGPEIEMDQTEDSAGDNIEDTAAIKQPEVGDSIAGTDAAYDCTPKDETITEDFESEIPEKLPGMLSFKILEPCDEIDVTIAGSFSGVSFQDLFATTDDTAEINHVENSISQMIATDTVKVEDNVDTNESDCGNVVPGTSVGTEVSQCEKEKEAKAQFESNDALLVHANQPVDVVVSPGILEPEADCVDADDARDDDAPTLIKDEIEEQSDYDKVVKESDDARIADSTCVETDGVVSSGEESKQDTEEMNTEGNSVCEAYGPALVDEEKRIELATPESSSDVVYEYRDAGLAALLDEVARYGEDELKAKDPFLVSANCTIQSAFTFVSQIAFDPVMLMSLGTMNLTHWHPFGEYKDVEPARKKPSQDQKPKAQSAQKTVQAYGHHPNQDSTKQSSPAKPPTTLKQTSIAVGHSKPVSNTINPTQSVRPIVLAKVATKPQKDDTESFAATNIVVTKTENASTTETDRVNSVYSEPPTIESEYDDEEMVAIAKETLGDIISNEDADSQNHVILVGSGTSLQRANHEMFTRSELGTAAESKSRSKFQHWLLAEPKSVKLARPASPNKLGGVKMNRNSERMRLQRLNTAYALYGSDGDLHKAIQSLGLLIKNEEFVKLLSHSYPGGIVGDFKEFSEAVTLVEKYIARKATQVNSHQKTQKNKSKVGLAITSRKILSPRDTAS